VTHVGATPSGVGPAKPSVFTILPERGEWLSAVSAKMDGDDKSIGTGGLETPFWVSLWGLPPDNPGTYF